MGHEDVFEVQTIGQIGVHVFLPSGKSLAFVSAQYHAPNPRLEPPRQTQEKASCYNMAGILDAELKTIRMSWEEAKQIALDRDQWKEIVTALYVRGGTKRNDDDHNNYQSCQLVVTVKFRWHALLSSFRRPRSRPRPRSARFASQFSFNLRSGPPLTLGSLIAG